MTRFPCLSSKIKPCEPPSQINLTNMILNIPFKATNQRILDVRNRISKQRAKILKSFSPNLGEICISIKWIFRGMLRMATMMVSRMCSHVHSWVSIDSLNNINFSMARPSVSIASTQHPDSWPRSFQITAIYFCWKKSSNFNIPSILDI